MTRGDVTGWLLKGFWIWLGLVSSLSWPIAVSASDSLPPLLKQSKILSCAKTESVARRALSSLWRIEDAQREFPDENMQGSGESSLHAASLDIVLKSLLTAAERFPSLRNQVERTLLKWNYCDVFQEGVFYDLAQTDHGFKRYKAAEVSPEKWQGFKGLGFLGETDTRFVPSLLDLDQNSLRSDYEWFFHRIYREQCFPHPDTSEMFEITDDRLQDNIVKVAVDIVNEYPHSWDSECVYPRDPPKLKTLVNIEILPQIVPQLISQLKLTPVPQLVPGLITKLQLLPVAQLVPRLSTQLKLLPVAQSVPVLNTRVELIEQPVVVPMLKPQVAIYEVPQLVPALASIVDIQPVAIKVPFFKSKLVVEAVRQPVPKLATKFWVDKPKYLAPKRKQVNNAPVLYADNRAYTQRYYPQPIVKQPKVEIAPVTKFVTQPSMVANKNASLIERLLGGLSGAGNVLIVDKIQLTVNEYNGSVETAISSSDIGTTVTTTENRPEIVKEILNSLPVKTKRKVITAKNKSSNKKVIKAAPVPVVIKKKPLKFIVVPELRTMLLVSEVSLARTSTRVKKVVKATNRKRGSSKKKNKDTSSSVFTYSPYRDGTKKAPEKSVEQLLLEYQQYEKDMRLGRLQKRKISKKKQGSQQASVIVKQLSETKKPDARLRDVAPLNTEVWVEENTITYDPIVVPTLKSKVKVYKKFTAKPVKVPALSTMIIQQFMQLESVKKTVDEGFEFSKDHFSDDVFEATKIEDVEVIKNQLDQLFVGDLSFSTDRLSDEVFEDTLISGKKKTVKKLLKKKAKKAKPKKKTLGLAGNVYLKHSLKSGEEAIGGSINRKLIKDSYWFARVGWNYALETSEDPFSYSWGIGYSDWHSGTFSAQLNNWGPIKPEEGLALEKAVASFGYSVKSEFLKKNKLSLSGAINVPVEGNSSVAANLRWSPVKNWYVNASVSQPLEGDGSPKWTYGFGYSDWRPNKINLQYSNYGPNEIPYHNYEENGTWSLSYNWKF